MALATGKTLGFERIGLPGGAMCTLYISAKGPPSDGDWDQYVAWFRKTVKAGDKLKSVVFERSSGPNAAQRKQINDMTASCTVQVAVLAPSAIARGIVTAMNWFKKDSYKAFLPDQMDASLTSAINDYLAIPDPIATEVKKTIRQMMTELDK